MLSKSSDLGELFRTDARLPKEFNGKSRTKNANRAQLKRHRHGNVSRFQGVVSFAKNQIDLGPLEVSRIDHCGGDWKLHKLRTSGGKKSYVIHGRRAQRLRNVGPAIRQGLCGNHEVGP